jgi:hypothetical protein
VQETQEEEARGRLQEEEAQAQEVQEEEGQEEATRLI